MDCGGETAPTLLAINFAIATGQLEDRKNEGDEEESEGDEACTDEDTET